MGSNFFRQGLDPIGSVLGHFAGNNSWMARMAAYDPLASSSFGKFLSPSMYSRGQAYLNQQHGPTPSGNQGFTGDVSLANANQGYVNAARQFNQPQPVRQTQPVRQQDSPYQGI